LRRSKPGRLSSEESTVSNLEQSNDSESSDAPVERRHWEGAELNALIAGEVARQLERERALIQSVGGVALKVIGAAFAALVAFLTALAITDHNEVRNVEPCARRT
jgi:hypothetical protein